MEEIKCSWAYCRDAVNAAMEALEKGTAICRALRERLADDALAEWDKRFPEYAEQ